MRKPCAVLLVDGRIDIADLKRRAAEARPYKDADGIEGRLRYHTGRGTFGPYETLTFEATARGKQHPKYLETKRALRDDWVTDVLKSEPDVLIDHLQRALRCRMP